MRRIAKSLLLILTAVVLLMVLAVGAVIIFKPEFARALYNGLMLDSDQIEEKKKENDKQLVNTINDFGLNITEEDAEKLGTGELSEEEIKDILLGGSKEKTSENKSQSDGSCPDTGIENIPASDVPEKENALNVKQNPVSYTEPSQNETHKTDETSGNVSVNEPEENSPADDKTHVQDEQSNEHEEKTAELIAKMYALKSRFVGQINGVVASMKAEYSKLPKEQQNMASKTSIANRYLGQISALEAQCDAQVDAIVTELRDVLVKSGQDTSLADAVLAAYNNEKETTKAAYINRYSD